MLTADRPPELRDIGAGQTIDQLKLYGDAVRWFCEVGTHEADDEGLLHFRSVACRAYAVACGDPRPGPVHLNVPWREPLAPIAVEGQVTATDPLALEGRDQAPLTSVEFSSRASGRGSARPDCRADRGRPARPDPRRSPAGRQARGACGGAGRGGWLSGPRGADLAAPPRATRPLAGRLRLRPHRPRSPEVAAARAHPARRRPADQQAAAPVARRRR